jgi:hypothetical protein
MTERLRGLVLGGAPAVLGSAALGFVGSREDPEPGVVAIFHGWCFVAVVCAAWALWSVSVISSRSWNSERRSSCRLNSISFVVLVCVMLSAPFLRPGDWRLETATAGSDAQAVHLTRGFQDVEHAVAVRLQEGVFSTTYRVAAIRWQDRPPTWLVVRPEIGVDGPGVYLRDGRIIALNGGDPPSCAFVVSERDFRQALESGTSVAADSNRGPFILVGPDDEPRGSDVTSLTTAIRDAAERGTWDSALPTDAELLAALRSPNRKTSEAASRLIVAGGTEEYPAATEALR